jgi:Flp pilus assembly pilin Flp
MSHLARRLLYADQGQDITEYSLLLAFVVLTAASIFVTNGTALQSIWITANGIVNQAAVQAHAS